MSETIVVIESAQPQTSVVFSADQGPQGIPGPAGTPGTPGTPGAAATIAVGTTTTLSPGSSADVTNSGTSSAAVFDFAIPEGARGINWQGVWGSTTTYQYGDAVEYGGSSWFSTSNENTGDQPNVSPWSWELLAQKGTDGSAGAPGAPGAAATVSVGTTTTGAPGSSASVTNSGSTSAAVFNFTVPQGPVGPMPTSYVSSYNGSTGAVTGVASFNGSTGAVTGVASFNGSTGAVTGVSSVSAGTTGLTPSTGTTGDVTLAGTLALTNGGTGKTSAPAAMANLMGFTSTATAAGITQLFNTSSYYQQFTGTNTQTVRLPTTSTLQLGWTFHIVNNSTGNLSLQSSGGNAVITIVPGTTVMATCIVTGGTGATDWEVGVTDFSTYTGTGDVVLATSPTLTSPVINNPRVLTPREITTVTTNPATGTINFDALSQSVLYSTASATANWTFNVRGSGVVTLNTTLTVGDALTVTYLVTNGATAYYPTAFTIDGTAVTPKWQGGTAPAAGNASSVDAYVYTIVKTAATPTYTVFASQTKFA